MVKHFRCYYAYDLSSEIINSYSLSKCKIEPKRLIEIDV